MPITMSPEKKDPKQKTGKSSAEKDLQDSSENPLSPEERQAAIDRGVKKLNKKLDKRHRDEAKKAASQIEESQGSTDTRESIADLIVAAIDLLAYSYSNLIRQKQLGGTQKSDTLTDIKNAKLWIKMELINFIETKS